MEISPIFESSTYAAFSPDGCYIASLSLDHLHIQNPTSLTTTYTFPLDTDSAKADSFVVHWSHDSQRILLVHPQVVLVFTIGNAAGKVRIDNGSAGLGRIVDAEILDGAGGSPQAMVVWEFGRVAIWDLATGKGSELGDLKGVGKSEVRGAWGIGRTDSGGQALAMLSRQGAQDVLSIYVSPLHTPLVSLVLPSTNAQSLSWSPCGRWLVILESQLYTPAAYTYTAGGHPFRSNRPNSRPTERQLALSANGRYLALLDPATPTSISVFGFNTDGQVMHTLLSQYAAVRSLSFSPHVQNQLLLVAETGVVYTWAADADAPPMVLEDRFASVDGGATRVWAEWIGTSNNPVHPLLENGHDSSTSEGRKPAILISSKKKGWVVIWPDGRPRHEDVVNTGAEDMQDDLRDDTGDVTEDSLYEVLTGSPSKKSLSRHMDGDEEADDERLDDTFREKKVERAEKSWEDDSEIF
ncbi:hypothetical protein H2203_000581 [Taxawa tesnikishii (nom. ined.)]|nr:hypothetical protein H2203_000581 [Dothideales sp. JES 119]